MERLIGRLPKIGIRPIIDGRQNGIRESLEEPTMNIARNLAKFLSSELRHPNGQPVECVIADTTIGGVAEEAQCADKFQREGVGVSISVTTCWCYGSETMDVDPTIPKAIWGVNRTERPGAVYLAAVLAAHNQMGLPAFSVYGRDVQDVNDETIPEDVKIKLLNFARAGLAVATMKGKSYLSIGSVSMGIAGSIVNDDFFREYLGMRNEYVDMSEVDRRINLGIYDYEEFEKALKWTKEHCKEGKDNNDPAKRHSREQLDKDWETCVKMALIFRDLMIGNPKLAKMGFLEESRGHNAIAAGFQGQRNWTDQYPNGDFAEAILNSSFDWNGIRQPFMFATEDDTLNAATMLLAHLLTGTAQVFADVRTYWSPAAIERVTGWKPEGLAQNGLIHLLNSGSAAIDATGMQIKDGKPAIKPFWEISENEMHSCLKAVEWSPANLDYMRGGGFSSTMCTKGGMPVTMARLNIVKGLGPMLQLAEGYTVDLPENVHEILSKRTDPTWPTTWFAPIVTGEGAFKDVYTVMAKWGANHGSYSYGHIGDQLITLASMLRIPVSMHNIEESRIFRPSAWDAFGTSSIEDADYRACDTYGPLY